MRVSPHRSPWRCVSDRAVGTAATQIHIINKRHMRTELGDKDVYPPRTCVSPFCLCVCQMTQPAAGGGDKYLLLASGLGIGGKSNMLPLKLLVDFVCGHLGGGKVRRKWFWVEVRTQFVNVTVHAGLAMYIYIYIYI